MKKQDLLDTLLAKPQIHSLLIPDKKVEYGNLVWYTVTAFILTGNDAIRDQNIAFYVEDEGLPTEKAYWSPSEPFPAPVNGFQQEVTIYITSKIADGIIEGAFPEMIDQVNKSAIYKVVMPDLSEKRLFVDKDQNGDLRHRQMV